MISRYDDDDYLFFFAISINTCVVKLSQFYLSKYSHANDDGDDDDST